MSRRSILASARTLARSRTQTPARTVLSATALSSRFAQTSPRTFSTSTSTFDNMKAILIKDGKGPIENLYLGEEATPTPKKGECLVKVRLISLQSPY